jgi:menaquinone-dependent protoporphyrinogen oxidase
MHPRRRDFRPVDLPGGEEGWTLVGTEVADAVRRDSAEPSGISGSGLRRADVHLRNVPVLKGLSALIGSRVGGASLGEDRRCLMSRILVVYGTRHGQTERIAQQIAATLEVARHEVDIRNLISRETVPDVSGYDAVIVGGSVHEGRYEREVRRWASAHVDSLEAMPNAFYSVSLTSATRDERHDAQIEAIIERFEKQTGWRPARIEKFAGALQYSKYNWLLRRIMRGIARHESGERYTDMTHDYDLADYEQVEAFARDFARSLTRATTSTTSAAGGDW